MAEDFELGAAITVEDTSELDGLSADVAAEGGDGAAAGGGGGDFLSGILERLGGIGQLLSTAVAALGVITVIPGLLSGVFRLLEVFLAPIGILFQNLLAPLIQRLLRFFATSDIFGKIESFARQVVDAVTNFIAGVDQAISNIGDFFSDRTGGEFNDESIRTGPIPGTPETETAAQAGTAVGSASLGLPGGTLLAPLTAEFTASAFDSVLGENSSKNTKEDGPS